jgi:opacity protein-like surface antigen
MMEKLNGYARLGVYNGKAKISATSTNLITQAVQSGSETKRSTNAVYGIGVDYALNAQTSIRGEITNYARMKVPGDDKNDVALFSVGVAYKF